MTDTIERLHAARIDAANRLNDADTRLRGLISDWNECSDADRCAKLDTEITAAKEERRTAQGESDAAEMELSAALTEERIDSERQWRSVPEPRPMLTLAAHREKYPHTLCRCDDCGRIYGHNKCEAACEYCGGPTGKPYRVHWQSYVCNAQGCVARYEAERAEQERAEMVAAWRESRRALRAPRRPQTARY